MWFLIRSIFWLSLVLLLIPFGAAGNGTDADPVSPAAALSAARDAAGDIAGMCERKPEVCAVGRSALHTIGVRARDGARLAYEMLDSRLDDDTPVVTPSRRPAEAVGPQPGTGGPATPAEEPAGAAR